MSGWRVERGKTSSSQASSARETPKTKPKPVKMGDSFAFARIGSHYGGEFVLRGAEWVFVSGIRLLTSAATWPARVGSSPVRGSHYGEVLGEWGINEKQESTPRPNPMAPQARHESVSLQETFASR